MAAQFFGTCAGAILLAREVHGPQQKSLNLLDIAIERNAYGRQLASRCARRNHRSSAIARSKWFSSARPLSKSPGTKVEVLAESEGHPVLVQQGRILAATFHPELTSDSTIHEYLLRVARNGKSTENNLNPAKRYRVLFVCLGNSCRSPMAEAIARQTASDVIVAASAGTMALGFVAPPTLRVLEERGINVAGLISKPITRETRSNAEIHH